MSLANSVQKSRFEKIKKKKKPQNSIGPRLPCCCYFDLGYGTPVENTVCSCVMNSYNLFQIHQRAKKGKTGEHKEGFPAMF